MKIGKAKEPGIAGVTPARKKGDPKPPGYVFGKPTSYRPEYCQAIVTYFSNPESWDINTDMKGSAKAIPKSKLPTFERFAAGIGVTTRALENWRDAHEEFGEAYRIASGLQKSFLMELSAAGLGTGAVALMLQINHKMRLEKEEEQAGNETIQKVVVEVVGASQHKGD
jgi:hypothetical protein